MSKTYTAEQFKQWGKLGALKTNKTYTTEKRRAAAYKAWKTRNKKTILG